MRRVALPFLILPALLGAFSLIPAPARADAWDEVLKGAGLSRETARFRPEDAALIGEGDFRLPLFNALFTDPLSAPFHMRLLRAEMLGNANNAGDLAIAAASRIGVGTRLRLLGDPLGDDIGAAKKPDALLHAIQGVWSASGRSMSRSEEARLAREIPKLPAAVAEQAALVLNVEMRALAWRNRGLAPVLRAGMTLPEAFDLAAGRTPFDDNGFQRAELLMHTADLKRMTVGGELCALVADHAATELSKAPSYGDFALRAWTPLGWILLNGDENDTLDRIQPNLLILDTGGNDRYRSGAATYDARFPVSILVDVRGDDRYINDPALENTPVMQWSGRKSFHGVPSFGAGILGYGVLVDAAGNDIYRSTGPTQGRAFFGLGLVQDRAGDDTYDSYSGSQGCADFGTAILEDLAGNDRYLCFQTAQGYGGTMGFGLLLDRGNGNDTYEANDTILDDPSFQTPKHNTSMAQGVGNGRRADFSDGHSLAGGIGMLLDEAGNNTLTCGLFGQGTGYWMGIGLCSMGAGNDVYKGVWYVQGSAAHFAIGLMDEQGGDDSYTATDNMAQGAGHDFSVGWLVDRGGNDTYMAPSLALGGGNANGFGFFWDVSGNDTYQVSNLRATLGDAAGGLATNSVRERNPTLGIFLDTGGRDTYPPKAPQMRDNALWTVNRPSPSGKPTGGEHGAGLDTEAPNTPEPE